MSETNNFPNPNQPLSPTQQGALDMMTQPAFPKELGVAAVLAHRKEMAPDVVANIQRSFQVRAPQAPAAVETPVATIPQQREPQTHRESLALGGKHRRAVTVLPEFSQEQRNSRPARWGRFVLNKLGIRG